MQAHSGSKFQPLRRRFRTRDPSDVRFNLEVREQRQLASQPAECIPIDATRTACSLIRLAKLEGANRSALGLRGVAVAPTMKGGVRCYATGGPQSATDDRIPMASGNCLVVAPRLG